MAAHDRSALFGVIAAVVALGSVALCPPASAQGIFERIFSGLRHAVEAPSRLPGSISSFADPLSGLSSANPQQQIRAENGPSKAFCVRTCDGHFFPVQAHAGLSSAESCHAFCPASQTRLYSGSNIDYAVANDGSRYTDLNNAFVYRKQVVDNCTCNGHTSFGLARMDTTSDPTLRPGDVVATESGLMAFTGTRDKVADFTPIDAYRGLSKDSRDKLSDVKIMPPNPGATAVTPATISTAADRRDNDRNSAQLSR